MSQAYPKSGLPLGPTVACPASQNWRVPRFFKSIFFTWDMPRSLTPSSIGLLQPILLNLIKNIFIFTSVHVFWLQYNLKKITHSIEIYLYVYYELLKFILRNPSGRATAVPSRMKMTSCHRLPDQEGVRLSVSRCLLLLNKEIWAQYDAVN